MPNENEALAISGAAHAEAALEILKQKSRCGGYQMWSQRLPSPGRGGEDLAREGR